ncbi:HNH endonuclease family protein [Staphylococcus capitis]|uniref:HNH endonuclease family protein n=1 Tax=Staphylococcus capitis TaxID=29388 RepID=UPI0021AB973A|nr:HNH endonuclease family protein [Staphylococcus capitis]
MINKNNNRYSFSTVLIYILLTKKGSGRIPSDDEMLTSLKGGDWYNMRSTYRNYLFERLENFKHNEPLSIFEGLRNHNYSIEHIMPQTLSDTWKKELGNNYKEIHTKYLNTLGNLTITGYNSKYSNRSFDEKQNMDEGFKHSHFTNLNQLPAQVDIWTDNEIQERTTQLSQLALKIWKYPTNVINNDTDEQEKELVVFDGEETFTGHKIKGFILLDEVYIPVNNWIEFFEEVFRKLMSIDVSLLVKLSKIKNGKGIETIVLDEKSENTFKLAPNIFIYFKLSNMRKMEFIKQLLDLYKINYEELKVDVINNER